MDDDGDLAVAMAARAAVFADAEELDYSTASLDAVEKTLGALPAGEVEQLAAIAAYLGEVVRRHADGARWVEGPRAVTRDPARPGVRFLDWFFEPYDCAVEFRDANWGERLRERVEDAVTFARKPDTDQAARAGWRPLPAVDGAGGAEGRRPGQEGDSSTVVTNATDPGPAVQVRGPMGNWAVLSRAVLPAAAVPLVIAGVILGLVSRSSVGGAAYGLVAAAVLLGTVGLAAYLMARVRVEVTDDRLVVVNPFRSFVVTRAAFDHVAVAIPWALAEPVLAVVYRADGDGTLVTRPVLAVRLKHVDRFLESLPASWQPPGSAP